jgi:hypothetical protein
MIMEYNAGDYIAYKDKDIVIVWQRNAELFVYDVITGAQIDRLYHPEIDFIDDVDYIAADYAEAYHTDNPQKELAL